MAVAIILVTLVVEEENVCINAINMFCILAFCKYFTCKLIIRKEKNFKLFITIVSLFLFLIYVMGQNSVQYFGGNIAEFEFGQNTNGIL